MEVKGIAVGKGALATMFLEEAARIIGYREGTGWRTEIGYKAHALGRVCTTR